MSIAPKAADRERHGLPRLVRELEGKTVRLLRSVSTGMATYPEGAVAKVHYANGWGRITLLGETCACCGVALRIARMSWRDIEVIGQ